MDANDRREAAEDVAIARVELLYPFARDQLKRADRLLPEPEGGRLGPGGAAEHGRLEGDVAADARAAAGGRRARLHRPARARQPGRGLLGAHAHEQERIVLSALTPSAEPLARRRSAALRRRGTITATAGLHARAWIAFMANFARAPGLWPLTDRCPVDARSVLWCAQARGLASRPGRSSSGSSGPRGSSWRSSRPCSSSGCCPASSTRPSSSASPTGSATSLLCLLIWVAVPAPRGALHPARRDADAGRPAGQRDRDRADRAQGLGRRQPAIGVDGALPRYRIRSEGVIRPVSYAGVDGRHSAPDGGCLVKTCPRTVPPPGRRVGIPPWLPTRWRGEGRADPRLARPRRASLSWRADRARCPVRSRRERTESLYSRRARLASA